MFRIPVVFAGHPQTQLEANMHDPSLDEKRSLQQP